MIYKRPLRLTIRHLEQRVRMDDVTFMLTFPSFFRFRLKIPTSRIYDYTCP